MSLIDDIKNQVKKSGSNKGKIIYFKPGVKVRVRFLKEMDEGIKVLFHDSFSAGINLPCQEIYDRECVHHEDEDLRHGDMYIWSVWDYEAKEVKLLMGRANNYSPVPALVGFFDTYGSIKDRDYVITKNGSGTNQSWSIVPMDKVKFRNEKAKPYSESKILSILDKAYPNEDADEDEDEEPKKKKRKAAKDYDDEEDEEPVRKKKGKKKKPEPEDEEEEDEGEDFDDEEEEEEEEPLKKKKTKKKSNPYEDVTAKELYLECVDRGLKVKQKMDEDYYIEKLEASDEEDEDEPW